MRTSNTSVELFHLSKLAEGINNGTLGVPEFQRDFTWTESDVRSLLATVFQGWPAGSLLVLEGKEPIFQLKPMEGAPPLSSIEYSVLDGQQRLTSLYQALYGVGKSIYAIQWDASSDKDIEEFVITVKRKIWDRSYASIRQNIEKRVIPISVLKTASDFFLWRDAALEEIDDKSEREKTRKLLTDFYTYRLGLIHSYEFPVVKLKQNIQTAAISLIFEKVNKTGLTLNTFDLMVAKSFDVGWNLRDRWVAAQEEFPALSAFFGEDGLPLLQAISLIKSQNLRQSGVLELSKSDVQQYWDRTVQSASRIIKILRENCGVIRPEFMPYNNLLPPMIALDIENTNNNTVELITEWFWHAGFSEAYDAAANTRLASHYKAAIESSSIPLKIDQPRTILPIVATKKSQKALWNTIVCATIFDMERRLKKNISTELILELEVASLFSAQELQSSSYAWSESISADTALRSAVNIFLVPKRMTNIIRKAGSVESMSICRNSELELFSKAQLPITVNIPPDDWMIFAKKKIEWLNKILDNLRMKNFRAESISGKNTDY
ncbi:GmrSD restriction endonuclease domain-containing protein [Methylobacterium indicum]|uniref:GmrSD restriction endonuclease domain-containing protein n=1 Tax=Methylobacterium indicum TaxID=1775910 RepID=UPI0009E7BC4E|nr:DUF262 domain-containing protein [Methylobacterium indicum]